MEGTTCQRPYESPQSHMFEKRLSNCTNHSLSTCIRWVANAISGLWCPTCLLDIVLAQTTDPPHPHFQSASISSQSIACALSDMVSITAISRKHRFHVRTIRRARWWKVEYSFPPKKIHRPHLQFAAREFRDVGQDASRKFISFQVRQGDNGCTGHILPLLCHHVHNQLISRALADFMQNGFSAAHQTPADEQRWPDS